MTRTVVVIIFFLLAMPLVGCLFMTSMPGRSYSGPLQPLSPLEVELEGRLRDHVTELAGRIGARNVERPARLEAAARFIERTLAAWFPQPAGTRQAAGASPGGASRQPPGGVTIQRFDVRGVTCENLEVEIRGVTRPDEIVIVGAHYDSCGGTPGANDNGTGTAAVLELARIFSTRRVARTLRFAAFVNEEPPHFQTDTMGSLVYARRCRERDENVVAMLSLETMGYYSDEDGSQSYPFPFDHFYPSTGNFIAFVGNIRSRALVRDAVRVFRENARFPSEGGAIYGGLPGVGWSDHWSFWQQGYKGLMVTDTAPFRYPFYHDVRDVPAAVDFERLARVVAGLVSVVEHLAGEV